MLLRSSSTPLLNSWVGSTHTHTHAHTHTHSPEPKSIISLTTSCCSNTSPVKKMSRASSETELRHLGSVSPRRNPFGSGMDASSCVGLDIRNGLELGLGFRLGVEEEEEIGNLCNETEYVPEDGGSYGSDGDCGAGAGSNGGNGFGGWDSSFGSEGSGTDEYYQKMIEANPGNSLLLGNYAKFLKEVKGDYDKAEEYCGRAILSNPNDGNVLSLYASLIWETQKDSSRAQTYFDQAVKAAPDDCYVLASYAKFLWDAEDEEEEEEQEEQEESKQEENMNKCNKLVPSRFFHGVPPPPIAAA